MPVKTYHVIGLLSGSSLDGTDLAALRFEVDLDDPRLLLAWSITDARTVPYPAAWIERLQQLPQGSAKDLVLADTRLGHYYGALINEFIQSARFKPDLISSHGHTIFHFPHLKTTTQIGDGAAIVSETDVDTVTQLRSVDVAYGAQGAPLAPLGDRFLFPGYTYYLNLGGIANITTALDDQTIAFDICTCNQIFNGLARTIGKEYDDNGALAASGRVNTELLHLLQSDEYHERPYPKSLDNTWSQEHQVIPAIQYQDTIENKLCTGAEFVAIEIAKVCAGLNKSQTTSPRTIFVTGGGAFNEYLISRMKYHCPDIQFVLPAKQIIEFKEVSFIGLAGLWRYLGIPNLYASVTGAPTDTINGALYLSSAQSRRT
jgi:anhydro-N-acetylmuramic acid kinase